MRAVEDITGSGVLVVLSFICARSRAIYKLQIDRNGYS